jgi:hypothetical protein
VGSLVVAFQNTELCLFLYFLGFFGDLLVRPSCNVVRGIFAPEMQYVTTSARQLATRRGCSRRPAQPAGACEPGGQNAGGEVQTLLTVVNARPGPAKLHEPGTESAHKPVRPCGTTAMPHRMRQVQSSCNTSIVSPPGAGQATPTVVHASESYRVMTDSQ